MCYANFENFIAHSMRKLRRMRNLFLTNVHPPYVTGLGATYVVRIYILAFGQPYLLVKSLVKNCIKRNIFFQTERTIFIRMHLVIINSCYAVFTNELRFPRNPNFFHISFYTCSPCFLSSISIRAPSHRPKFGYSPAYLFILIMSRFIRSS